MKKGQSKTKRKSKKKRNIKVILGQIREKNIKKVPFYFKEIHYLLAILAFISTFLIYLITTGSAVGPRDSAELTVAGATLGIPHPPGYPLYVLLAKLFSFLPLGSIAFRINLMSAFFASLTIVLIYLIVLRLIRRLDISLLTSFCVAFSFIFWDQAVFAEVFTPNSFFVCLLIFILITWRENKIFKPYEKRKNDRLLYLFSFCLALSFCSHYTVVLLIPGFIYIIFVTDRKVFLSLRLLSLCLIIFLIGLSPFIYLPIRSLQNPSLDTGNPETITNFIKVITRAEYGTFQLRKEPFLVPKGYTPYLSPFFNYLVDIFHQFTIPISLVALTGIFWLIFREKKFLYFFLLLFLISGPLFVFVANLPVGVGTFSIKRLYIPSVIIFALFFSFGFEFLGFLIKYFYSDKTIKANRGILSLILILSLFPIILFFLNYSANNKRNYYFAEDFANNILKSLKPDSLIYPIGDTALFSLYYLQQVEDYRNDVKMTGSLATELSYEQAKVRYPELFLKEKDWQTEDKEQLFLNFLEVNIKKYPIYFVMITKEGEYKEITKRFAPEGVAYRLMERSDLSERIRNVKESDFLWRDYVIRGENNKAQRELYFTREIFGFYASEQNFVGMLYGEANEVDLAQKSFQNAIKFESEDFIFYYNLGLTYLKQENYNRAIINLKKSDELEPDDPATLYALGFCYLRTKSYQKAIEPLQNAIKLNPNHIDARLDLSACYYFLGNFQQAEEQCKEVLKSAPDNKRAKTILKKISEF